MLVQGVPKLMQPYGGANFKEVATVLCFKRANVANRHLEHPQQCLSWDCIDTILNVRFQFLNSVWVSCTGDNLKVPY